MGSSLLRSSISPSALIARAVGMLLALFTCHSVWAQSAMPESLQFGLGVPPDVEQITAKALAYLAESQNAEGNWDGGYDSHGKGLENCGVVGLATMAMLSTGDDANVGPYAANIRAALRYIITTQNQDTGYLPNTMYNHGFAMLALAEAYGTVDDDLLWGNSEVKVDDSKKRTIGQSLRMAVDLAVKSQSQNPFNAWRYHPMSQDADTSVSGAVLVGLLAARNAGIRVPRESIENAVAYFNEMTSRKSGVTMYEMAIGAITQGANLSAISTLVMAVSQNRDLETFSAARKRIEQHFDLTDRSFPFYNMYYMAQALFQANYPQWERWNKMTIRRLRRQQASDGSFESQHGAVYGTAMACLSLALNYRFLPIYER